MVAENKKINEKEKKKKRLHTIRTNPQWSKLDCLMLK